MLFYAGVQNLTENDMFSATVTKNTALQSWSLRFKTSTHKNVMAPYIILSLQPPTQSFTTAIGIAVNNSLITVTQIHVTFWVSFMISMTFWGNCNNKHGRIPYFPCKMPNVKNSSLKCKMSSAHDCHGRAGDCRRQLHSCLLLFTSFLYLHSYTPFSATFVSDSCSSSRQKKFVA